MPTSKSRKTDSTCSSRSSNTNNSESEDGNAESSDEYSPENSDDNDEDDYSSSEGTLDSEIEVNSVLFNFPTQIICLD